ncbi:MAG: flagellar biosynthetic protein FliO [Oscillospiraceae bacterium]|nr:flagellar biosynthetic protein FliO [Oscillospiraceae bacterium]
MEWLRFVLSFSGIIGLILFMFWMLRKVSKMQAVASGNKLRIIDRANTGRDSSLLVVSVSGKLMLVGVSAGKIEKLCDLSISEEDYFGSAYIEPNNADKPGVKFSDILSNIMNPNKRTERKPEREDNTVEPDNKKSDEREWFNQNEDT